ncbi:hypothetical protein Q31a_04910 [Aureliella helgolandensis]|uniref:Uncharacterized protein n=2 Tax=Aureliella helgolandensis TaxID=2527968 RepID=A0A518G0S2_9BACT|nr:hypothetical protein Q31a_04910 [Aureliella helgolandensis]
MAVHESSCCCPTSEFIQSVESVIAAMIRLKVRLLREMTVSPRLLVLAVFANVAIVFAATGTQAQDIARDDATRAAIKPTIVEIEAVMLGKKHRPLAEFVATDAIFEEADSPLIPYLERIIANTSDEGERSFPEKSKLFWTMLPESTLLPIFKRYPKLDPTQAILVFRELDRRNGQLKAIGYVLQRFDREWKVVFGFDGNGPEDQLSKNAIPFEPVP